MRVALVEPWFSGHRGIYVERLSRHAAGLGYEVDVVT